MPGSRQPWEDLKKITVPTLILHGSDDQIAPIEISGNLTAKIVKHAKLVVYDGAPACSPRKKTR
jgi:non-heme chloroperoxidase